MKRGHTVADFGISRTTHLTLRYAWRDMFVALYKGVLPVLFVLSLALPALADLAGTVVAVIDGDTIRLRDAMGSEHEVHLYCADAPELGQPNGDASARYLAGLIADKEVEAQRVQGQHGDEGVAKIVLRNADINFRMVKAGFAWHPPAHRCGSAWDSAQRRAQQSGRGLWADTEPVPPWEYREAFE